jgi:hypothetical protein
VNLEVLPIPVYSSYEYENIVKPRFMQQIASGKPKRLKNVIYSV